jgi:glycosyltransferase 2 family protein
LSRKALRWLLTGAGIAAFVLLLNQFGLSSILAIVGRVRWALLFLLALQLLAEFANAAGWGLCFPSGNGPPPAFATLVRLRLAGDGINYLVPTATIGGELLRIDLLDPVHARADRTSSVVLARLAQDLALAALAAAGFWLVATRTLGSRGAPPRPGLWLAAAVAAVAAAIVGATWRWMAGRGEETRAGRLRRRIEETIGPAAAQLRSHPARFAAAVTVFGGGYLWGAVEAFWICRLIGRPVSVGTAIRIEILSLMIDAIVFLVPAKIGTQEAGKTLIFVLLGLPARDGFAFGVLRHVREFFWAGVGLAASAASRTT